MANRGGGDDDDDDDMSGLFLKPLSERDKLRRLAEASPNNDGGDVEALFDGVARDEGKQPRFGYRHNNVRPQRSVPHGWDGDVEKVDLFARKFCASNIANRGDYSACENSDVMPKSEAMARLIDSAALDSAAPAIRECADDAVRHSRLSDFSWIIDFGTCSLPRVMVRPRFGSIRLRLVVIDGCAVTTRFSRTARMHWLDRVAVKHRDKLPSRALVQSLLHMHLLGHRSYVLLPAVYGPEFWDYPAVVRLLDDEGLLVWCEDETTLEEIMFSRKPGSKFHPRAAPTVLGTLATLEQINEKANIADAERSREMIAETMLATLYVFGAQTTLPQIHVFRFRDPPASLSQPYNPRRVDLLQYDTHESFEDESFPPPPDVLRRIHDKQQLLLEEQIRIVRLLSPLFDMPAAQRHAIQYFMCSAPFLTK